MSFLRSQGQQRRFLAGTSLFLVIVFSSAFAIWLFSSDARREIDALAIASSDVSQWSLAQSEVEFLALENAVLTALVAPQNGVQDVKRRFDVFYSRIQTFKHSAAFDSVHDIPEVMASLENAERFLADTVSKVDGPEAGLIASLPQIAADLDALRPDIRVFSVSGIRVFAARSESQREHVAGALLDLGLIAFLLMVILLAVVAILLVMTRASQRQAADIALTESRLQAIISTSLDGIIVINRDAQIIDYNGAAGRIFGYSRNEVIGEDMADKFIPDHLIKLHVADMERYRRTGSSMFAGSGLTQLEAKRKDGSVFPVEFSANMANSHDGQIMVAYIRDISQRVADEKELVAARDKALAGEKAKAELLAVMSHEMRTPLNGVLGTLQLLAATDLNERQRKFVNVMDMSGKMLLEHVNNVLDISRADAGKVEVSLEEFDAVDLTQSVVDSLRNSAGERGNTLSVSVLNTGYRRVIGDQVRLRQILVNLLGNAIKFTQNGQIAVEVEPIYEDGEIEFRVIDSGIGIADDDIGRIFEDFVTLDTSYGREVEGTGLGLGIVKRLVKLLNGEIGVESEPGEGSVFWFRLPLPAAAELSGAAFEPLAPARPGPAVAETALMVLVVEDNEINRMVAREMLEKLGCQVTEAHDGQDGVAQAAKRQFDLILMDISMPRMDGTAATELIRKGGLNAQTPIVALTAHAMTDDIQRFKQAGMTDVITKPLLIDRLDEVLREICGDTPGDRGAGESGVQIMADLHATLGRDRVNEIVIRVNAELETGFEDLQHLIDSNAGFDDIKALAHKLAGAAAIVGFDDLRARLIEIEVCDPSASAEVLTALLNAARTQQRLAG